MNRTLAGFSEDLRTAPDLDAFWTRSLEELARYGITGVFYGAVASRHDLDPSRLTPAVFWKSNYPKAFFEAFGEDQFLDNEETAVHCIERSDIIYWHRCEDRDMTPEQRLRTSIERDMGLHVGFSIPTTQFSPSHHGGFGISIPLVSEAEFPSYWRDNRRKIIGLLGMIDTGLRRGHMSDIIGLSGRERDVLTWLACGLRPDEIAERLGIGYRSVDKYVNRARFKLKSTTRDQAVAKALIFNLIRP